MLFNNTRKKSHLHYGNALRAKQTIRYLKGRPKGEQVQGAQAMYYRAKFHAQQTKGMRNAMKIYRKFLRTLKRRS
jgi:hypothetical protein